MPNATPSHHARGLLVCLTLAALLLGSWLHPATRAVWDALDAAVFFALNGTLATPSPWSLFWAALNSRVTDLLPLLVLLPFLLVPDWVLPRERRIAACCHLFFILALMLVVRTLLDVARDTLAWRGHSASLTLQPAHLLSEMYPALDPKDTSKQSFPGDHSGVLLIVAGFLVLQRRNGWTALASLFALFFMLPRLVGGAHWLTDIAVGSSVIALCSLGLGYFTPWPHLWAEELGKRIYQHPLTPRWLR